MRQSTLFTRTRKDAPSDEVSKNAKLLIRAGFIHKEMAGVYSYLPLGLRVLNNIVGIIREEMNAVQGQEVMLTSLQDSEAWKKTDRWNDASVEVWFKTKLKNGSELGLAFTHEEALTNLMRDHIRSFRDLPAYVYQFQTKFRNEIRAKSGIMRGREFLMKDLYSFCRDAKEQDAYYEKVKAAYMKIFTRAGIGEKTYPTVASGGSFSKYSHEFQTETNAGEDIIYVCDTCKVAVNDEIIADQSACPDCGSKDLRKTQAVEVGNIFPLGTKYSDALGLSYVDEKGEKKPVFMGSYGIGPGRLMGTIVEILSDEKGIVWPKGVAPFDIHLIALPGTPNNVSKAADALYEKLQTRGVSVLYDEREIRAGEKFADADLIGIPERVVMSEKTVAEGKLEVKKRTDAKANFETENDFFARITE